MDPTGKPNPKDWADLIEEDQDFADEFNRLYDNTDVPEEDDVFDPDSYDTFLGMELSVGRGDVHPMCNEVQ